jgi:hypothetical protein
MRKRILEPLPSPSVAEQHEGWLDIGKIAVVEVTSEDRAFPIEAAFDAEDKRGWRASQGGEQMIRIVFDQPLPLHRIRLRFHEAEFERTQEFALRWWPASGGPAKEIVRQQWNFSPGGSTTEDEVYQVDLKAVSVLELALRPDLSRREAVASLAYLCLA